MPVSVDKLMSDSHFSTKMSVFVDKPMSDAYFSTEMSVFMDKCAKVINFRR